MTHSTLSPSKRQNAISDAASSSFQLSNGFVALVAVIISILVIAAVAGGWYLLRDRVAGKNSGDDGDEDVDRVAGFRSNRFNQQRGGISAGAGYNHNNNSMSNMVASIGRGGMRPSNFEVEVRVEDQYQAHDRYTSGQKLRVEENPTGSHNRSLSPQYSDRMSTSPMSKVF